MRGVRTETREGHDVDNGSKKERGGGAPNDVAGVEA